MTRETKERLLALIKEAPHGERCNSEFGESLCSCWKREALEIVEFVVYGEEY